MAHRKQLGSAILPGSLDRTEEITQTKRAHIYYGTLEEAEAYMKALKEGRIHEVDPYLVRRGLSAKIEEIPAGTNVRVKGSTWKYYMGTDGKRHRKRVMVRESYKQTRFRLNVRYDAAPSP